MAAAGNVYTSVTLAPPANFEAGMIVINNVQITPNGSGQYVCASISNATLCSLLMNGWVVVAFTA